MSGLVEGSDYYFRVSAENEAGAGATSKELGPLTAKTPVKFVKQLDDQEVKVEDCVTLVCEVNKDNTSATWYKDGTALKSSPRFKISSDGRQHILAINDITLDDESQYSCKVCMLHSRQLEITGIYLHVDIYIMQTTRCM